MKADIHNGGNMSAAKNARRLAAAGLCLLSALCGAPAFAGGGGSVGMQVLKSDISPRAMAMGGAFTAVADDIYSLTYNPAGLGQLYIPEASAMYLSGFDDAKLDNIAAGMPLPIKGMAGISKPAVGLSLLMSDAGSFNLRQINDNGTITSGSFDAQKDLALTFGYGERVYSEETNIMGYKGNIDQYFGLSGKYVKSTILENYSASCFAFDLGWLVMDPELGLAAGASWSNLLDTGLRYGNETTKLPSIVRAGLSYQRPTIMDQSFMLALDGDFNTNEGSKTNSLRLGMEYHFEKIFNLRLGYRSEKANPGITMGFGLRYDDMSFDFATGMGSEVYNTSELAFTYKFSGIKVKQYKKNTNYKDPEPAHAAPKPAQSKPAPAAPAKKKDSDFFWIY